MVAVAGEPEIGGARLVDEAAAEAGRGAAVVRGRASESAPTAPGARRCGRWWRPQQLHQRARRRQQYVLFFFFGLARFICFALYPLSKSMP